MNIEKEIFERCVILSDKLIEYGFIKENAILIYSKKILNDSFEIIIEYNNKIEGRIVDLSFNEEYTNYRVNRCGGFAQTVKDEFISVLLDIKEKCCVNNTYVSNQANNINKYICDKYMIKPEFPWEKTPYVGVYKNDKRKWFAIIMDIPYNKVNKESDKQNIVEIMNVKIEPDKLSDLLKINGIYEAYHMNKKNWISITLDGTLDDNMIFNLIDNSYILINNKQL